MPDETADALRRFARKVVLCCAGLGLAAAAASPLWAWGRPDRVWGFVAGAAASLVRLAWSLRLAREFGDAGPARYATMRLAGMLPLAATLAAAGLVDGIDLAATAVGVFFATAGLLAASLLEARALAKAGSGPEE